MCVPIFVPLEKLVRDCCSFQRRQLHWHCNTDARLSEGGRCQRNWGNPTHLEKLDWESLPETAPNGRSSEIINRRQSTANSIIRGEKTDLESIQAISQFEGDQRVLSIIAGLARSHMTKENGGEPSL